MGFLDDHPPEEGDEVGSSDPGGGLQPVGKVDQTDLLLCDHHHTEGSVQHPEKKAVFEKRGDFTAEPYTSWYIDVLPGTLRYF